MKNCAIGAEHGWILAEKEVCYVGDKVAIVVADSEHAAEEALELIEVDYEPLPAVTSLEDSVREDAPPVQLGASNLVEEIHTIRGDIDGEFAKADLIVSESFHFPYVVQGHLEPNSAAATYYINGELTVYCASQVWFRLRAQLSMRCGLPESRIVVRAQEVGGAFGARNEQLTPIIAAIIAMKTGIPQSLPIRARKNFIRPHPLCKNIDD